MESSLGGTRFTAQDVIVNDVRLRVLTAGPDDAQPIVCLHGFPDTPHTWLHQFPALLEHGYRIIVPFLRGYPPSETGPNLDYFPMRVIEDAVALVRWAGREDVLLLGHDWGAMACFGAAQCVPELLAGVVVVAVPHPAAFSKGSWNGNLRQAWRSRYAVFFQMGWPATWAMGVNNMVSLDYLWKNWSPDWHFSASDIQPLKDCLGQPGAMTAATEYYRATVRGAAEHPEFSDLLTASTAVPTLVCAGVNDGCIGHHYFSHMDEGFRGPWQFVGIEGAGHFVHREKPEAFNRALLEYLQRSGDSRV